MGRGVCHWSVWRGHRTQGRGSVTCCGGARVVCESRHGGETRGVAALRVVADDVSGFEETDSARPGGRPDGTARTAARDATDEPCVVCAYLRVPARRTCGAAAPWRTACGRAGGCYLAAAPPGGGRRRASWRTRRNAYRAKHRTRGLATASWVGYPGPGGGPLALAAASGRIPVRPSQLQGVHTSHQSSSRRPPASARKVRRTFASGAPKSLLWRRGSSPHRFRLLLRALRHHQVVVDTRSHVRRGRAGPAQLTGLSAQRAACARDLQPRWCVSLRRSALLVAQRAGGAALARFIWRLAAHALHHSCPHL